MTVNLSALGGAGQQFFDNNGDPLTGGKLYSYEAGTTTPQATYTTAAGNVPHSNPIILDAAGRVPGGEIWVTASQNYKFVLKTSTEVTLATWDNITGINGTGIATNAVLVAYDPAGTGAVATNVQAKLRESVSVKDFGALGNGVTDDTVAIQTAINYAVANNKTLSLVDGVYSVTTGLNVTGELTLEDGELIAPNWLGDGSLLNDWVLNITGNNCVIQRVKIDGYKKAGVTLRVTADSTKILNCVITRPYRMGIFLREANNSLIDGNKIFDIGDEASPQVANGIYLNTSTTAARFSSKNNIITNNHITDVFPNDTSLDGDCIQIQGADTGAIDNGNPNDARATIVNTLIANNYLARCASRCVKIQDSYVNVSDNIMEDADQGVSLTGGTAIAYINIVGNTFNNMTNGHTTGGTTVLNLCVADNQYNNLAGAWILEASGGIIQNAIFNDNIIYVSPSNTLGRLIGLGALTRPSGSSKNITISNNQFFNVGLTVSSGTGDFDAFMVISAGAKNINFTNNLVQTKDLSYVQYFIRVFGGSENIKISGNNYVLGTNWYPYRTAAGAELTLTNETPELTKVIRNNTIASGSTTIDVTHNLEVNITASNRIFVSGVTGATNDIRAFFQKFTVVPKNNSTNNVTYFVAPLTQSQARVTLSGDPGASGFIFDLNVDLSMDNETIPASV